VANFHLSICYAGLIIAEFAVSQQPAMLVNGGATVNLVECDLVESACAIGNFTLPLFDIEEAPIAQPKDTIIRLNRCVFRGNLYDIQLGTYLMSEVNPDGVALVVDDPSDDSLKVTYSFFETDFYFPIEKSKNSTGNASTVPADRKGINSTSAWFQWVQKVRFHCATSQATSSIVPITHPPTHSW
jgi:hypothetical protein